MLVAYLFSATAFRELVKIPLLAEHYYDHREENKNTGLIAFLVEHYLVEDGTDADAAEDGQLPFKSTVQSGADSFVALTPPIAVALPAYVRNPDKKTFITHHDLFLPAQYIAAIWQPPRSC